MKNEECNCDQALALEAKLKEQELLIGDLWLAIENGTVTERFFSLRVRVRNVVQPPY